MTWRVIEGDCIEAMAAMDEASVDAVVTDPPAGISFMGKTWDHDHGGRRGWVAAFALVFAECLRVLKPGGHAFVWALPRTSHWTACALEDAGFEIRDCVYHMFGSGFPKSMNLDGEWAGWGTALKPAAECWWLARKPLIGTVAANVQAFGTGALNIDGTRIGTDDDLNGGAYAKDASARHDDAENWRYKRGEAGDFEQPAGRWPANVVLDPEAAAMLDEQTGERPSRGFYTKSQEQAPTPNAGMMMTLGDSNRRNDFAGDTGGASRFFYTPKSSREERNRGLPDGERSSHPTVKPVELMRWLVRLVTPPGGLVLDPFTGSGSTGVAALREGFDFIGIEREPEYVAIARDRICGDAPLFNVGTEVT